LRENYKEMTYEEIGEHLGRTAKAVNAKAGRLNLKRKREIRPSLNLLRSRVKHSLGL